MKKKIILCFIGMSGVGKDTVVNKFLKRNTQFEKMIPITTRPIRKTEIDGVDYKFVTNDEFQDMIDSNLIMEHRKYTTSKINGDVDTWFYGNPYPETGYSVMIGTIDSYTNIKNSESPDIDIYPIYLSITDSERLYRMVSREHRMKKPNFREMIRRFYQDQIDFSNEELEKSEIVLPTYENKFIQLDSNTTVMAIEEYVNKIINENEVY